MPPSDTPQLGHAVLKTRYLQADEACIEDVQQRVAWALADAELGATRETWAACFLDAQRAGFIPGGRINAHAGTKQGMLVNCFVQPASLDSGGVSAAFELASHTLRMGGGVGYDFSTLPPGIHPVAAISQFDAACSVMASQQARRCAQMAVLRCDHPDVLDFIHAKDRNGLENFNLSVAITDDFMVRRKRPDARSERTIWEALITCAQRLGEPGVLFIDTINRDNNLGTTETISATNPCGEQPLPEFGACVLGSINLTRFVDAPFSAQACFDFRRFGDLVHTAIRMLDNVLTITVWPLPAHAREAKEKRRIGLGVTGLADALIMLGLRYGSREAANMAASIARTLRNRAYFGSVRLARERGAFPQFHADTYLSAPHFSARLPRNLQQAIHRWGIRNSHVLAIAPTGSISLAFGDNVANNIEPVIAWHQLRTLRTGAGSAGYAADNFAWRAYQRHKGVDNRAAMNELPDEFVTAAGLSIEDHLTMLAAIAPFIDAGISKTVALPAGATVEDVGRLFERAWQLGIKGLTCFPAGSRLGAVIRDRG